MRLIESLTIQFDKNEKFAKKLESLSCKANLKENS